MPESVSFTVWTLPHQTLSTNGKRRDGRTVAHHKGELGDQAFLSAMEQLGPQMPVIRGCRVDIALTFHVKHHAKTGDGLYRPLDPSNVGGECIKPVIDYGLTKHGIIEDDDYTRVRYVVLSIEHADRLEDERIEVYVRPVPEEEEAP